MAFSGQSVSACVRMMQLFASTCFALLHPLVGRDEIDERPDLGGEIFPARIDREQSPFEDDLLGQHVLEAPGCDVVCHEPSRQEGDARAEPRRSAWGPRRLLERSRLRMVRGDLKYVLWSHFRSDRIGAAPQIPIFLRFLHANTYPLRSKTLERQR